MITQELFQDSKVAEYRKALVEMQQDQLWKRYDALNHLVQKQAIVFAGDSLTEFFPTQELLQASCPIYNRGIRGITSLQLLEHLKTQIVDLEPKQLFLLIGVNDLKARTVAEAYETIKTIIFSLKQDLPQTTIFLLSLLPINTQDFSLSRPESNHQSICQLNAKLKKLSEVNWIELHDILADDNGQLRSKYSTDGIHLTVSGYQCLVPSLQSHLN